MDNRQRAQDLTNRYLEGLATTVEVAELQQKIVEDPAAADIFARASRFDSMLLELSNNNRTARETLRSFEEANEVVGLAIDDVDNLAPIDVSTSHTRRSPLSNPFQLSLKIDWQRSRHNKRSPLWAGVAVTSLVGLGFAYFMLLAPPPDKGDPLIAEHVQEKISDQLNPVATPLPGTPVAVITKTIGARFARAGYTPAVGDQFRTGLYQLTSGIIELTFTNSPAVILEAPCEFDLKGEELLLLHRGRMSARIPKGAGDFVVETPSATVFDQDTEFGLQVDDKEDCEVHVFDGKVSVTPRLGSSAKASVLRGKTASIIGKNSSTPCGIDVDSDRFLRSLSEPESEYARLILDWKPALYFRMLPAGGIIQDDSTNHIPGIVVRGDAKGTPWTVGRIGSALQFGGPSVRDYAVVPDYPKSTDGRMTVVAWVVAKSRPRSATIAKNWAGDERGQFQFGLHHDSGELEACITDGSNREVTVKDKSVLTIGKWQHVAFVADGTMLRLFRNGVEVGCVPYSGIGENPNLKFMGIGVKLDREGNKPYVNGPNEDDGGLSDFWHGRIDELALFNYPLKADQIQQLFESAGTD